MRESQSANSVEELRSKAANVVREWDGWFAYLSRIGVAPETRGIAQLGAAIGELRKVTE